MLTKPTAPFTRVTSRTRRAQAIIAAAAPTARVAHLGHAALTVALAALPALVTVARSNTAIATPFLIACLVGGATFGWAIDDPAADLLAPLPVSTPTRAMLRVMFVALVAVTGIATTVAIVAIGPGLPPDRWDRLAEAAASASVAIAVGLVAARRGERGAGPIGVTAGLLGTGLIAALAFRWPTLLPSFGAGPTHVRWWIFTGLALAVAAHAGRDPARR